MPLEGSCTRREAYRRSPRLASSEHDDIHLLPHPQAYGAQAGHPMMLFGDMYGLASNGVGAHRTRSCFKITSPSSTPWCSLFVTETTGALCEEHRMSDARPSWYASNLSAMRQEFAPHPSSISYRRGRRAHLASDAQPHRSLECAERRYVE